MVPFPVVDCVEGTYHSGLLVRAFLLIWATLERILHVELELLFRSREKKGRLARGKGLLISVNF